MVVGLAIGRGPQTHDLFQVLLVTVESFTHLGEVQAVGAVFGFVPAGSEAEVDPATTHLIDLGDGDCEWSRLIEGSRAHECAKTNGGRVTCQTSECDPGMCGSGKA